MDAVRVYIRFVGVLEAGRVALCDVCYEDYPDVLSLGTVGYGGRCDQCGHDDGRATQTNVFTFAYWLSVVAAGEREGASIQEMDYSRHALAYRADRLGRKRGARREYADLVRRYDAVLARLLASGWR